jgi:AcrR family transcriptional regulator
VAAKKSKNNKQEKPSVRELILAAARELFATLGYEAVTMRQVAQKINYTPTTIYLHFQDKQQLINDLCSQDFLALAGAFQHLNEVKDPVERLCRMALEYMSFGLQHPNHYKLLFMTPHPSRLPNEEKLIRRGNPAEDAYAFLRSTVIECIAAGQFRKEYRDPELVSQILWASIHGVTSLHIARGNDPWFTWRPPVALAEAILDIVTGGMAAGNVSVWKNAKQKTLAGLSPVPTTVSANNKPTHSKKSVKKARRG